MDAFLPWTHRALRLALLWMSPVVLAGCAQYLRPETSDLAFSVAPEELALSHLAITFRAFSARGHKVPPFSIIQDAPVRIATSTIPEAASLPISIEIPARFAMQGLEQGSSVTVVHFEGVLDTAQGKLRGRLGGRLPSTLPILGGSAFSADLTENVRLKRFPGNRVREDGSIEPIEVLEPRPSCGSCGATVGMPIHLAYDSVGLRYLISGDFDEATAKPFLFLRTELRLVPHEGLCPSGTEPLFRFFSGRWGTMLTRATSEASDLRAAGWKDQGVLGCAHQGDDPGTIDLYRLVWPDTPRHLFTTDPSWRDTLLAQGWRSEGIAARVWPARYRQPIYLSTGSHGDRFLSPRREEGPDSGYSSQGVAFFTQPPWVGRCPASMKLFRRLYLRATGEHFYTHDENEAAGLVALGWRDEGDIGCVSPVALCDTVALQRFLFSSGPSDGKHGFTTDPAEANEWGRLGVSEGVAGYVWTENDGCRPPRRLEATQVTLTSIALAWDDLTPDELDFELAITEPGGQVRRQWLPSETSFVTVNGLSPATGYCFQVRSRVWSGQLASNSICKSTASPIPEITGVSTSRPLVADRPSGVVGDLVTIQGKNLTGQSATFDGLEVPTRQGPAGSLEFAVPQTLVGEHRVGVRGGSGLKPFEVVAGQLTGNAASLVVGSPGSLTVTLPQAAPPLTPPASAGTSDLAIGLELQPATYFSFSAGSPCPSRTSCTLHFQAGTTTQAISINGLRPGKGSAKLSGKGYNALTIALTATLPPATCYLEQIPGSNIVMRKLANPDQIIQQFSYSEGMTLSRSPDGKRAVIDYPYIAQPLKCGPLVFVDLVGCKQMESHNHCSPIALRGFSTDQGFFLTSGKDANEQEFLSVYDLFDGSLVATVGTSGSVDGVLTVHDSTDSYILWSGRDRSTGELVLNIASLPDFPSSCQLRSVPNTAFTATLIGGGQASITFTGGPTWTVNPKTCEVRK